MRRTTACLSLVIPILLSAASAPFAPISETADAALARAQAEARQAARRLAQLESQAARAGNEAERLKSQQLAAAAAIEDTEAKMGEQDARLRLAQAQAALAEQRLAAKRAPLAALLAGLATMGRQPPILALADQGSIEEMIRVKALLDATMPVIERRSALLRADVAVRQRSAGAAAEVRRDLAKSREELSRRRQRFAELEATASERAARLAGEAFGAGDRVLASDEALATARSEAETTGVASGGRKACGSGFCTGPANARRFGASSVGFRLQSAGRCPVGRRTGIGQQSGNFITRPQIRNGAWRSGYCSGRW